MKPSKVLLLLTIVMVVITVVSTVSPEALVLFDGRFSLKIPDVLPSGTFPFQSEKDSYVPVIISELPFDTIEVHIFDSQSDPIDSVVVKVYDFLDSTGIDTEKISSHTWPIDFPERTLGTLEYFFGSIHDTDNLEDPIRIMHYGDSQIEGDRISSTLREKLQNRFGGSGPGGFPATRVVPATLSYVQSWSTNWDRYVFRDVADSVIDHNRLGPYLSVAETWKRNRDEDYTGWIRLRKARTATARVSEVVKGQIIYGGSSTWQRLVIFENGQLLVRDSLPPAEAFGTFKWKSEPVKASDVRITFEGPEPFDLYGLTLDGTNGITLDNIPLRGSSGLEFTKVDMAVLKRGFESLDTRLIILQFGVNIVPVILEDYGWYERSLVIQLEYLRKMLPETAILVIGVSDMSMNGPDGYTTYPNIELIRDAQKAAALSTGCAFWDSYLAMGGRNSMPLWVAADPTLARTDYTHLTNMGSAIMGNLIYNALMDGYEAFSTERDSLIDVQLTKTIQ